MNEGLNQMHVTTLLHTAQRALTERFGLRIGIYKPFHTMSSIRPLWLAKTIRRHRGSSHSGVIVAVSEHWTVVDRAEANGLRFLDSWVYRFVRYDGLIVGRPEDPEDE